MKYLLDVIYYQIYKFYYTTKIMSDAPYVAFLFMGLSMGLFIVALFDLILCLSTGYSIFSFSNSKITIIIFFILVGIGDIISYQLFRKKKRYIKITKKKPLYKDSVLLSIFITIMYLILSILSLCLQVFMVKHFFNN